jgi:hypothetical protein
MSDTVHVVRWVFGQNSTTVNRHGLIRAFVSAENAQEWLTECEIQQRERRDVNPFHFSPEMDDITSMPEEVLHDWLIDHDYPQHHLLGPLGWEDWWEAYHASFTDEQHRQLWCRLDRVRFFEVTELDWHRPQRERRLRPPQVWVQYVLPEPIRLVEVRTYMPRLALQGRQRQGPATGPRWVRLPLFA